MEKINVLQLGNDNWINKYNITIDVNWTYCSGMEILDKPERDFDIVLISRELTASEVGFLQKYSKVYTVFATDDLMNSEVIKSLFEYKCGSFCNAAEMQNLIENDLKFFFNKGYGEKLLNQNLKIAQGFHGKVSWNGNCSVIVEGQFGSNKPEQAVYWSSPIPIEPNQILESWLEYKADPGLEVRLRIVEFRRGISNSILKVQEYSEEQLKGALSFVNGENNGELFISVLAKGNGRLEIVKYHNRFSRGPYGIFEVGDERELTSKREEVFSYFSPGDMKPPLCVYFAGYKTQERFEAMQMMKKMGRPFLLLSDVRLEGGCFYLGDEEYEQKTKEVILRAMKRLGFGPEQVILSGISMGSFGALYYACDIKPYAVLIGKPLTSIGDIALNERINRPGVFPTSLDVLLCEGGHLDKDARDKVNHRFWDKFDNTRWTNTQFIVAYMIEDDYDSNSYNNILSHLHSAGVVVYGKGLHGRHNDNTPGIIAWFKSRYTKLLNEDFGGELV